MNTTNFITAIAIAAALLFSACNKTESGNTDKVEVPNYSYDSETNTYTVYTAAGLLAWNEAAQDSLSLNCTLAADIDLTNSTWTPVGNYDNPYTGTFEGGGHTITGLTVKHEDSYAGLIGYLGVGSKVQDLTLKDVDITGSGNYVGGVVGRNFRGTVTNCTVSGTVSGSGYVGGVAGRNTMTITSCTSSATVSGSSGTIGGVVGYNYSGGTVIACSSSGTVSGTNNVGGVVGKNESGTVTACYNASGSISATYTYIGGVVGYNDSTVTACYWSDYEGNGIGYDSGSGETTEVDGSTTTWKKAINYMNVAIYDWNEANPDNQCDWQYELTGDLPTLTKNE